MLKYFFRNISVLFLFIVISLSVYSQSKTELQKEKAKLEQQISITSRLLEQNRQDKNLTLEQLQLITSQVRNQQRLINNIQSSLDAVDKEIDDKRLKIKTLKDDLERLKEEYARMIYFAYLTRSSEMKLMYIFSSSSMTQAFQRMRYIQEYAAIRKRQAVLIVEMQAEIEQSIIELENARQEKLELLNDLKKNKTEMQVVLDEKNKLANQLKSKEAELKAKLRKQQKQTNNLQNKIQAIIKKEIETSRKNNTPVANNDNQGETEFVLTPDEIRLSNTFEGNKGRLPWPVSKGIITSRYGSHPHPVLAGIKVKNNGIDIAVPSGEQARAVFEGKVSGVISLPNGNKAVIIRHGEYLTVYSNIKSISVKTGDQIQARQNIGSVGKNDNNQYLIHFEVWHEKQHQNPEYWISK